LNHAGPVGHGLLDELHHIGFGLEGVARGVVALAEVRPDVCSEPGEVQRIEAAALQQIEREVRWSFCNL